MRNPSEDRKTQYVVILENPTDICGAQRLTLAFQNNWLNSDGILLLVSHSFLFLFFTVRIKLLSSNASLAMGMEGMDAPDAL